MLVELISNSPHENNIALFKCYLNSCSFYKKVALSTEANLIIENEMRGYEYFYTLKGVENPAILTKKFFYEIDIPEFKGKKYDPEAKISGNEEMIEHIIDFYKKIWSTPSFFFIHGDLALCNVFSKTVSDFNVIDWEHFHYADKKYFGFDVIHMIFIALHNQIKKLNYINRRTKDFLKSCYRTLFSNFDINNALVNSPFQGSSVYIKNNRSLFKMSTDIEKKFVIAGYSQKELERLDYIFTD